MRPEQKQERYCEAFKKPLLAPPDGICYSCYRYIYDDGKTAYNAGKEHITGCPFCHRTYCD